MIVLFFLACLIALLGLEYKPKVAPDEPVDISIHPLLYSRQLCLTCEDYTGGKALREITRKGTCSTCGSKCIMRVAAHSWQWKQEEAVDREMAKIEKMVNAGENVVAIVQEKKKEKIRRKA